MKSKWIILIFMTIKHAGKNSVLLYDIFDTGVWHLVFTEASYITGI